MGESERERGTVVSFNDAVGHGIIRSTERGDELFVSFAGILGEGIRTLTEGQSVDFERVSRPGPPDGRPRDEAWWVQPVAEEKL